MPVRRRRLRRSLRFRIRAWRVNRQHERELAEVRAETARLIAEGNELKARTAVLRASNDERLELLREQLSE